MPKNLTKCDVKVNIAYRDFETITQFMYVAYA